MCCERNPPEIVVRNIPVKVPAAAEADAYQARPLPKVTPFLNSGQEHKPRWAGENPISEMDIPNWETLVDKFSR